jgi:hypothetical protein
MLKLDISIKKAKKSKAFILFKVQRINVYIKQTSGATGLLI